MIVYDKTNEALRISSTWVRGDIWEWVLISEIKGTNQPYAQLKGYEVIENNARYAKHYLKHIWSMIWCEQMKIDAPNKEVSIIEFSWNEMQVVQKSYNHSLETEIISWYRQIHRSAADCFCHIAFKDHRACLWSKLTGNTRPSNDLKVSMKLWQDFK